MVDEIKAVPTVPPPCHACGAPTKWSVTISLDGGALAECTECEHVTAHWSDDGTGSATGKSSHRSKT